MQPSKGLHNQVVKIVVPYCAYSYFHRVLCLYVLCGYIFRPVCPAWRSHPNCPAIMKPVWMSWLSALAVF